MSASTSLPFYAGLAADRDTAVAQLKVIMALAQRSTFAGNAAAQRRAAAPRAAFSSPVVAQLKQVCSASLTPRAAPFCSRSTHITVLSQFMQSAHALAAAQQPVSVRSVKAQVRWKTGPIHNLQKVVLG